MNTRLVKTALPDLYSDSEWMEKLESWFIQWEDSLPEEAKESLIPIIVKLDDELMG